MLWEDEKIMADNGYKHVKCVTSSDSVPSKKLMHSRIKARYETCNARMKSFNTLNTNIRQCVKTNESVFHAVSKIVWLMIDLEQPLFDI